MNNKIWVLTYTIGTNEGRKSRSLICDTKEQAIMQKAVLGGEVVEYLRKPEALNVNWPEGMDINGDTPAQRQGWIPVSEQMPDEDDHVLVSDGVGMEVSWVRGREWKKLRHIYSEDVTHWMPLPASPKELK